MALYLQLDGVDDFLQLPSLTITDIYIDVSITETGTGKAFYSAKNGNDKPEVKWNTNMFSITSGTGALTHLTTSQTGATDPATNVALSSAKMSVHMWNATAWTSSFSTFGRLGWTSSGSMKMNIYKIQVYNGATLLASYDMTTGTVQDQSGNGKHATLTGGTWLDDGTGGTPTGTDGSTAFDLKQILYRDSLTAYDSKQALYSDSSFNADLKQALYSDGSTLFDTLQQLFESGVDGSVSFDLLMRLYQDSSLQMDTKQVIYRDLSVSVDTNQQLFRDSSTLFDTLQQIVNDGIVGSISFDLKQVLFNDSQVNYDSKQVFYKDGFFVSDLLQQIYNQGQISLDTKQILFSDSQIKADTKQSIYADSQTKFDTLLVIYDVDKRIIGTIRLQGKRVLDVQLQGKQALNVNLKGLIQ